MMAYPLSQLERVAALKMQTELSLNSSLFSNSYSFTYELYNESSNDWVLCSWDENDRYWNSKFKDLHGDFGFTRTSYDRFLFSEDSKRDDMYVITRGIGDDTYGVDSGIEFDFENKTTLSSFMDSQHQIKVRINITNSQTPFKVILQSFGLGAFYWGLFSNKYGENYLKRYGVVGSGSFDVRSDNLLDLSVQSFEVVNSTEDRYLDLMVALGEEEDNTQIGPHYLLFDLKGEQKYLSWGVEKERFPVSKISLLNIDTSPNNFIISGRFYEENNSYYAHRNVASINWTDSTSFLKNYSHNPSFIDYKWTTISKGPFESNSTFYEIPFLISSVNDKIATALVLGDFDPDGKLTKILQYNTSNGHFLSSLGINGLDTLTVYEYQGSMVNLKSFCQAHKIMIGEVDVNMDGYYDLVGVFNQESIKIVDGKENSLLFNVSYDHYREGNFPFHQLF
jgi:hypothetical protein